MIRAARFAAAAALAIAIGCAPLPTLRPPPVPLAAAPHHEEPGLAGVIHVVRRGETIYRIARAYGIDAADLMETNGIADPRAIPVGTELFVPGATRVVDASEAAASADRSLDRAPASEAVPTPTATREAVRPERGQEPVRPERSAEASAGGRGREAARPERVHAMRTALAWPLKGVLYGRYGVRAGQRHDGIDIAAPEGAAVTAAADGTVIYAGEQPGYGAVVIVKHEGGLVTVYAHNSRVLVREGARVGRGDPVARVGQTGRTTGPHLHFEVREGTRPRNPLLFLP